MTNLRTLSSSGFTGGIINQDFRVLPFTCLLSLLLVGLAVICLILHPEQAQAEAHAAMYKALLSASEKLLVVYLLSQYIYLQGAPERAFLSLPICFFFC